METPDLYGLIGLVQTVLTYCCVVDSADWLLPYASLPLCPKLQDVAAAVQPLDATSWAEILPAASDSKAA